MPQNILAAIALAQAAIKIGSDIFDAVQRATAEGRDLTQDEFNDILAKKHAADDLAAAERRRLDDLFGTTPKP